MNIIIIHCFCGLLGLYLADFELILVALHNYCNIYSFPFNYYLKLSAYFLNILLYLFDILPFTSKYNTLFSGLLYLGFFDKFKLKLKGLCWEFLLDFNYFLAYSNYLNYFNISLSADDLCVNLLNEWIPGYLLLLDKSLLSSRTISTFLGLTTFTLEVDLCAVFIALNFLSIQSLLLHVY